MRTIPLYIFCLLLCMVGPAQAQTPSQAARMTIYCEYHAPEDPEKPAGYVENMGQILYGQVRELMRRTGIKKPILVASWKKGYTEATLLPDIGLFPTARTAQRETLFHWVGPILRVEWAFIGLSDSKLKINSLDEARKVPRIGVYNHDSREQWLMAKGFTNLVSSMDNRQNIKKLINRRIDLVAGTSESLMYWAKSIGVKEGDLKKIHVFNTIDLYLALSDHTNPRTVQAFQKAFSDMVADGFVSRLYEKWAPGTTPPSAP